MLFSGPALSPAAKWLFVLKTAKKSNFAECQNVSYVRPFFY